MYVVTAGITEVQTTHVLLCFIDIYFSVRLAPFSKRNLHFAFIIMSF